MKIEVELNAFGKGQIREVDVPDEELAPNDLEQNLEKVFYYGQNDFQPRQCPSVSVGDVVLFNEKRYGVAMFGFTEMGPDEVMCRFTGKVTKKSVDSTEELV